jgi:arylsulfatase A-like enzyme
MPFLTKKATLEMKKGLVTALGMAVLFMTILASGCDGKKEQRGVIVILLDALRRDHLSYYGYDRPTSPFLDGLIRKGVMFKNAVSAAPQTVPSVSSLLTGLYPYRHGSHFFSKSQSYHPVKSVAGGGLPLMKDENTLLAEVFSEAGCRTALVSANPGIRDVYGFSQGTGYFRYTDCFAEGGAGVCDGASLNRIFESDVLPRIKGESFFVYMHYMDVHYPYYKPNSFKGRFSAYRGEPVYLNGKPESISETQLEYTIACYDEGVLHLDAVLERLVGILEREDLAGNTLVVLVSDHGDEFLEHGGLGHGTTCYNELIDSFILFVNPALKAKVVESPVSLVDVFPTVVEWAGLPAERRMDGRSLSSYLKDERADEKTPGQRIILSELGDKKAIIDGPWKFIYNLDSRSAELYSIAEDPEEKTNIAPTHPDLAKGYFEIIKKILKKMSFSYSARKLYEDELKSLRSLGYIR